MSWDDLLLDELKKEEKKPIKKESKVEPKKVKKKVKVKEIVVEDTPLQKGNLYYFPTVNMTIDALRGIYRILTGIGDKKLTKQQLEMKIKEELLKPDSFGIFLKNLSTYLESI